MKNILVALIMLTAGISYGQSNCKLTYIANEGFMVETGSTKILVDALFHEIDGDWCHSPSGDTLKNLKNAAAPFNNANIIAVTHKHRDHFNKEVVASYMMHNSIAKLICPKQVETELSLLSDYSSFSNRIISTTPDLYKDTNIIVDGVSVRIFRLEHSHYMKFDSASSEHLNKHRNIENIGFLFNINGVKVFHCGDTNPLNDKEYSTFALQNEEIDIACLERLFFSKGKETIAVLDNYIAPKNIALMHVRPSNIQLFKKHFSKVEHIHVFERKLESLTYTLKK